ncbi:MAG: carotenoid oxygenase family protein, partial [Hyphomonadaceae bacterium]|nr:carotenoid oxygenase family protein [Hyphomonadaceae bacterium]
GTFFRNGPGQHERGGQRYHHWFDGDGLVHRWQIGDGQVGYRARFVDTPKRRAEIAAGRFLFPAGGGGIEATAPVTGPDSVNVANTSILPVNGELWALWEGGSATAMDPGTLATKGLVSLRDDLRGAPFSAHPRVGRDGRIWNVGYMGNRMALYRLSPTGTLDAVALHRVPPVGFIHDFLLTEKSVVVVLTSTRLDGDGDGMFAQIRGRPELKMQVKIYDRETLALTREAELPTGYVFHFGNAWEEADGTIRFDMVHTTNCDQVQEMRRPMVGEMPRGDEIMYRVTLPVSGAPRLSQVRTGVEFPRVAPGVASTRNRYVYAASKAHAERSLWFDSVGKFDLESGHHALASFGPDWMVEEHVFVPRPGATAEDDGWLVGTALNWRRQQTALNVLDARNPQAGPLARAWLDVAMPLGFHGQFLAA